MSSSAYSGSGDAGGKFRKRPFRHAPATPYDRPASAARGAVRAAAGDDSLRSRIVGTASRLIAGGATWILGSVFCKRLTVPPVAAAATTSLFNSSSQPFTSSAFGFTTGSSASSPSTGFAFGNSSSTLGSSSSPFGSAVFSFTSAVTTTSRASPPAVPVFGLPTSAVGFGSESPGSQMDVEHTTTNAANQAAAPTASVFGQPTNSSTTPPFVFGSGAVPSGGPSLSQFGGQQFSFTQGQPFQAGNLGFSLGDDFSQGTGVGYKAGRRIIMQYSRKSRK